MIKIKEFITRQREFEKSDYAFAKKLKITPQRLYSYKTKDIADVDITLAKTIWNEYKVEIYPFDKGVLDCTP